MKNPNIPIIAEHEKTKFDVEDWHMFFDMLNHPPRPTDRIKKAVVKYREITAPDEVRPVKA